MEQNLSLYYIFNSVAENCNISKAAKQLYLSQPAVSKAISNLEANLNVTLFIRNSRGVKLTDEGKLLYEHTKNALRTLQQGEESIRKVQELGIGHLHIGVSTTLCKYLLLPYLKTFVKENPHIKITIECQSSNQTLALLDNNELDIGLVVKPDNKKAYHFYSIGEVEYIFVATKDYLANLRLREKELDIFSSATIMLLNKENVSRQYIDDYFNSNNITPNHILEITNMDLLIEFAKISLGVGCVIKEFVKPELDQGLLIEIPLKKQINKREVGFCYGANTFLSDSLLKFINFIYKS
ncbi:MAG: LysR family transcriptional regulator [Clostridiales bacterium]|jgi:DNA-binding transcriptional LysR family regulator|nr:LysR family transcriptional regulator [Clostridiales bacterium]